MNEPENSLHPDLLAPLADLVAVAGGAGQILLTTHSREFADLLEGRTGVAPRALSLRDGITRLDGARW